MPVSNDREGGRVERKGGRERGKEGGRKGKSKGRSKGKKDAWREGTKGERENGIIEVC